MRHGECEEIWLLSDKRRPNCATEKRENETAKDLAGELRKE